MKLQLSSKFALLSRFALTLVNLYLVGYVMFSGSVIVTALSIVVFSYLLFKSGIMILYMQWRADNNWKDEWTVGDDINAWKDKWEE